MSLADELKQQFPELTVHYKGDAMLLRVKDVNEYDQSFALGGINDVVLHFLMPVKYNLKSKIEAYVRHIRPGVKRIIFVY